MAERIRTKEGYLKAADDDIRQLGVLRTQIAGKESADLLNQLIASLKDLRIVQEQYDSGEEAIALLYDRYLPYLLEILKQYIRMESSGSYDTLLSLQKQLNGTLSLLNNAIRHTAMILPQDEYEEALASQKAAEMKKRLDEISHKK